MTVEELLRPPTEAEVAGALGRFSAEVRRVYGPRLRGIVLFGSRARGDHRPDSDADVAVVLADGDWRFWDEKMKLVDLAYHVSLDQNLTIQPWPFRESEWKGREPSPHGELVRSARRDARSLP